MRQITQTKINKLRAATPRATIEDITTDLPEVPGVTEHLIAHLAHYAAPKQYADGTRRPGQPCLACDATSSFTWGLVHGRGHCVKCGWPGTLFHFIHDAEGKEVMAILGVLLWAHPDDIKIRQ